MTAFTHTLNRGQFLRGAAGVFLGGSVLGACGGKQGTAATSASGPPRRGGSLQVAIGSVSASENMDPTHLWNQNEFLYQPQIYDPFLIVDDQFNTHPVLAESWSSNARADRWTIKLRSGVKFHDGEPLTAADAVYTLRHILDPKAGAPQYAAWAAIAAPEGIRALDSTTLELKLTQPCSIIPVLLGAGVCTVGIMREGTTDFTKGANGTGPFKLASFVPGQSWELERNPTYWQPGLPYLEGIRGVAVTDPTTKAQSVLTGQSQLADQLDFSLARLFTGGPATLLVEKAVTEPYIILDTRHAPFNDNRVRMAFKLAMDRALITRTAYQGHTVLTSDTPAARTDGDYPTSLGIRAQNLARAKQLLSAAGFPSGLDVELHSAPLIGGLMDMTTAFAATVAAAGIRVKIHQDSADTYYEKIWRQVPMFATWVYHTPAGVRLPLSFTSNGAWQETHYKQTPVDAWVKQGYRALTTSQQRSIWQRALQWISDNEGYLNPGFSDGLFPASSKLTGVRFYVGLVRLGQAGLAS